MTDTTKAEMLNARRMDPKDARAQGSEFYCHSCGEYCPGGLLVNSRCNSGACSNFVYGGRGQGRKPGTYQTKVSVSNDLWGPSYWLVDRITKKGTVYARRWNKTQGRWNSTAQLLAWDFKYGVWRKA